jgi:predicted Zn-dependent protease
MTEHCTQLEAVSPARVWTKRRPESSADARGVVISSFQQTESPQLRITMDRVAMLTEILTHNPNDAFARYGLAMEYSNQGNVESAMEEFGKLLGAHPDYTAGYFMAAQALARTNRVEEAKKMLGEGIVSAGRTGNAHAQSEMEAMLAELG